MWRHTRDVALDRRDRFSGRAGRKRGVPSRKRKSVCFPLPIYGGLEELTVVLPAHRDTWFATFIQGKTEKVAMEAYCLTSCPNGACTSASIIRHSEVKVCGRTIFAKRTYTAHKNNSRNLTPPIYAMNPATSSSVGLPYA